MSRSKLQKLFVIPAEDERRTFAQDENLPRLPVPDLVNTLNRYLDSLKPFVTAEEYKRALTITSEFEEGMGRSLHDKLKQKAEKEKNWVEKWWEDKAYLEGRLPLLPYCNMDGVIPKVFANWTYGAEEDQVKHAALCIYYLVEYWNLLRQEKLLPTQTVDLKTTFSMSQYRRLFNTVRVPGEIMDKLVCSFKTVAEGTCSSTVVIMCKGRIFITEAIDSDDKLLSPVDWRSILVRIISHCNEFSKNSFIGVLTCDNRTIWSKNRRHLESISSANKKMFDIIDKSLFVVSLDEASPETDSDLTNSNLCGDFKNRWSDKSMNMIFYKNGRCGVVSDHTAFDGIILISCHQYMTTAIEESKVNWETEPRSNLEYEELKFMMDDFIKKEIDRVKLETWNNKKEILMKRHHFEDYGKLEIQRLKYHPDSYVQMILQLAYCGLHGKPASCYETATTRKFYNGRTETLRACTAQCLDWVASMLDVKYSNEDRKMLFDRAIKRHDELMSRARENAGCDRHLFGMYYTALEEGLGVPELYLDSSYFKSGGGGNFILSTSCVGYSTLGGGVAPMCKDGYGVFYNITPNKIGFTISVNTKSHETSATRYFESLTSSFRHTREVLIQALATKSKF